jgi:hypothetical protein
VSSPKKAYVNPPLTMAAFGISSGGVVPPIAVSRTFVRATPEP